MTSTSPTSARSPALETAGGAHTPALRQPPTPLDILRDAVDGGADVATLGKLLDLQERWEANEARKEFFLAKAAAKAEIPPIKKNRTGHNNKRYADFSAFSSVVDPILAKYGLSYGFRTRQDDKIHVTCVLFHRAGHSEENTLSGPPDTTGNKNAMQAIGSTVTYLQRYTLGGALGLAATEDDDGQAAGGDEPVTEEQLAALRKRIDAFGDDFDISKFCAYLRVDALPDLRQRNYQNAIDAIAQKERARK